TAAAVTRFSLACIVICSNSGSLGANLFDAIGQRTKPQTRQAARPDSHNHGFTRRGPLLRAIAASRAATTTAEGRWCGSFASIDRNKDPRGSLILHSSAVSHPGSEVWIALVVSAAVS